MPDNPFTYGNPISDPRRFIGREREVEQICGRLRNQEFESSSLVGDRRIGKTSLLNYLADPAVRAERGLGPERYIFVYVDLEMVDETIGPEQLWRRFLVLMRRHSIDPKFTELLGVLERDEQLDTFTLDEFFQRVDDKGMHVVFLLDEFEHVTSNANFGPGFFYGLRSLVIHHQLALVTSSRLELIELTHSNAIKSSPFFNIFANINLRLFSQDDSYRLISQSLSGTAVEFSGREIEQLFDLAGPHPYFLQAACWALYESYRKGFGEGARTDFLTKQFRLEAIPHLIDYWDNSDDYEKIVLTAAALLEQTRDRREFPLADICDLFARGEPTVERLEKRGLLIFDGGLYRLLSSMFSPWLLSQITTALGEEQNYQEWLTQNRGSVERITGKQGGLLKEILPKIRANYRELIITWASDPRTLVAVASLLKSALVLVN
jgi:hypothetical protein